MNERQKLRREESTMCFVPDVKWLRMIAVDLSKTRRGDVLRKEGLSVDGGEAKVRQAALIAATSGVTQHHGQDVDADMIVIGTGQGAGQQEAAVAAAEVRDDGSGTAEEFVPRERPFG